MIIKFDHIAYSCKKSEIQRYKSTLDGYREVFHYLAAVNIEIKFGLMQNRLADHDIVLFEKENSIPIEVTGYDYVGEGKKHYETSNNVIIVNTADDAVSGKFYETIGFKIDEDRMHMTLRPLIGIPVKIKINDGVKKSINTEVDNYLDSAGYCCLAFITNNPWKEKSKLESSGLCTTDIVPLQLGDKKMNIFFTKSDVGDICEYIGFN